MKRRVTTSCTRYGTVPVESGGIHPVEENFQKLFICHHLLQQTRVIVHRFFKHYFYCPLGGDVGTSWSL
jgi:hypothetical protein